MSYRITYGQNKIRWNISNKHSGTNNARWVCTIIIFLSLMFALSNDKVRSLLLPGNPQVTERALNDLVDNIQQGEPLKDAVTVFCKEILDNA